MNDRKKKLHKKVKLPRFAQVDLRYSVIPNHYY